VRNEIVEELPLRRGRKTAQNRTESGEEMAEPAGERAKQVAKEEEKGNSQKKRP
jgi:hypothetical protein